MKELAQQVYEAIVEKMGIDESELEGFTFDSPLFAGVEGDGASMNLDSIDALELVVTIYEVWGIDVPSEDMIKLKTINAIAEYIREKQN